MLNIGDRFPQFSLTSVVDDNKEKAFTTINNDTYKGQWLVVFSWPKDFTFVCPTEIGAFGELNNEFKAQHAQLLGFSTDSEFVHLAWRKTNKFLKDLPFPMMSDVRRDLTISLGVMDRETGVAQRATFIVDPKGFIRFVMVTDMSVGRNPSEVLRILKALETGRLMSAAMQDGSFEALEG